MHRAPDRQPGRRTSSRRRRSTSSLERLRARRARPPAPARGPAHAAARLARAGGPRASWPRSSSGWRRGRRGRDGAHPGAGHGRSAAPAAAGGADTAARGAGRPARPAARGSGDRRRQRPRRRPRGAGQRPRSRAAPGPDGDAARGARPPRRGLRAGRPGAVPEHRRDGRRDRAGRRRRRGRRVLAAPRGRGHRSGDPRRLRAVRGGARSTGWAAPRRSPRSPSAPTRSPRST